MTSVFGISEHSLSDVPWNSAVVVVHAPVRP
jgi:hypothetical protein